MGLEAPFGELVVNFLVNVFVLYIASIMHWLRVDVIEVLVIDNG